jgi:hypothetical protein
MALAGVLGLVAVGYVVFFHSALAPDLPEAGDASAAGS